MCGFLNPHLGLGTSGIQCCGLNTNSPFQYTTGASVYWNWASVVVVEVRGLFGRGDPPEMDVVKFSGRELVEVVMSVKMRCNRGLVFVVGGGCH